MSFTWQLTDSVWSTLIARCKLDAPAETCGLLSSPFMDSRLLSAAHFFPNIAVDPIAGFDIDPRQIAHLERNLRPRVPRVLFHSHPLGNTELSSVDKHYALLGGIPTWPFDWLVLAPHRLSFKAQKHAPHDWRAAVYRIDGGAFEAGVVEIIHDVQQEARL